MPLIQAKCTNCGGALIVDSSRKTAICPFCNQTYIVEEAINHYHKTVVVDNGRTAEDRIKAGESYLNLKMWPEAKRAFEEATDLAPYLYRGWWGKVRAITFDFTYRDFLGLGKLGPRLDRISSWESHIDKIRQPFRNALEYAPKEKKNELTEQFYNYVIPIDEAVRKGKERNKKCNELLQYRIDATTARKNEIEDKYNAPFKPENTDRVYIVKSGWFKAVFFLACLGCLIWLIITKANLPALILLICIIVPIISRIVAVILDKQGRYINDMHYRTLGSYKEQIDSLNRELCVMKLAKDELNRTTSINSHASYSSNQKFDEANALLKEIENSVSI